MSRILTNVGRAALGSLATGTTATFGYGAYQQADSYKQTGHGHDMRSIQKKVGDGFSSIGLDAQHLKQQTKTSPSLSKPFNSNNAAEVARQENVASHNGIPNTLGDVFASGFPPKIRENSAWLAGKGAEFVDWFHKK